MNGTGDGCISSYREFIERKRMTNEEQVSSILLIKREEKEIA
jgi:hypothetical protein